MPQHPLAIRAVNSSPLQQPISLSATGNYITVGVPGGPPVRTGQGPILTQLVNSPARGIAIPKG